MLEAVFISDLHLNRDEPRITARFNAFIDWAATATHSVYILGDFFHAWPGDDGLDSWSETIAARLFWLSKQGVIIYFMHGNRDFLLGKRFAELAGIRLITEPKVIHLGSQAILLAHGDQYCTHDKSHQWFRWLTRNRLFTKLFLTLPLKWRLPLVGKVREHSQANKKTSEKLGIVVPVMLKDLHQQQLMTLIHGHIHKPGLTIHEFEGEIFQQYVLSDWDDKPKILCYDKTKGFRFDQIDLNGE